MNMRKKSKLNSKNPKYMDKSLVTEKKVIRREQIDEMLMCELTELINNYYEEEKAQQ